MERMPLVKNKGYLNNMRINSSIQNLPFQENDQTWSKPVEKNDARSLNEDSALINIDASDKQYKVSLLQEQIYHTSPKN